MKAVMMLTNILAWLKSMGPDVWDARVYTTEVPFANHIPVIAVLT